MADSSTVAGTTGIEATARPQHVHPDVFPTIPEDGLLNQSDELDRRNAVGARLQAATAGRGRRECRAGRASRHSAKYDLYNTFQADRAEVRRRATTRMTWEVAPLSAGAHTDGL